jgi:hypothetical protein
MFDYVAHSKEVQDEESPLAFVVSPGMVSLLSYTARWLSMEALISCGEKLYLSSTSIS